MEKESIDLSLRFCCKIMTVGGDGRELVVSRTKAVDKIMYSIPEKKAKLLNDRIFWGGLFQVKRRNWAKAIT